MAAGAVAERERVAALRALGVLDTPPEERFDRLARLAARLLDAPIALVSLVDADRQWFKSCVGFDVRETPRALSFCAHALGGADPLVVGDAALDPRFAGNPLVTGAPRIRFYAGHPIRAAGGEPLGTLCVIDTRPRTATPEQLEALRDLAALVELELSAGELSRALVARRRSDERLEGVARARERFLRAAAHELRTPITSLRGYAEELLEPVPEPLDEDRRVAAEAVLRNAARLEALVEDMLLVLRLEAGAASAEREPVALAELVRAAAGRLAERARAAGVVLRVDADEATLEGDPRLLERAVTGLLGTAIAVSPAGGAVHVGVRAEPGQAVLTVTDAGGAIAEDEVRRAREPFYRSTARPRADATGFSATIARGVAEAHGGRAELRAAGDGTAVTMVIPRAAQASGGVKR